MNTIHKLHHHTILNIVKYSAIFGLFYINHSYYYSLHSPLSPLKIEYIALILSILCINSIIYGYSLTNHTDSNYILVHICSILYTIVLIDLEMMLTSIVVILMILYLYVDTILEYHSLASIPIYIQLIAAIYSTILNICIVLYNM